MCTTTYDIVFVVQIWGNLLQQVLVVGLVFLAVKLVVAFIHRVAWVLAHGGVVSLTSGNVLKQASALVRDELVLLLFAQSDCKLLSLAQWVFIAR